MLTLDCKEKNENLIRLPGKKLDDILELLKIIYPNCMKELDETKLESLLELSEEYDMRKMQLLIEKQLVKKLMNQKKVKLYGKSIEMHLSNYLTLIFLSDRYRLQTLRKECIDYVSLTFEKKLIMSKFSLGLDDCSAQSVLIEILSKQVDLLDEKLKAKDLKWKQMEDDLLRSKFEIQRLNNLNKS